MQNPALAIHGTTPSRITPPVPRDLGSIEPVQGLMLQLASGERFERLGAIVQEHLLTGGKKLRAKMALWSTEALGVPSEPAVAWAAACELLHNATLIHDDIQDGDEYRRGTYSVWVRHGAPQAINAGDLLLMLPFIALEHVPVDNALRWSLAQAIARRAEDTVRGQSLEMSLFQSCRWDWASYDEATSGKTSALMVLPVHGALLLAGRDPERSKRIADCFGALGLLYQMQDDVIDLFGDKGREAPGGDVRRGRVSALVVEHLRRCPEDVKWLCPILGKAREETTSADVRAVAARFKKSGALEGVLQRLLDTKRKIDESEALRNEPGLAKVADKIAQRALAPVKEML